MAVSDPLGLTAQPLATLRRETDAKLIELVRSVVREKEVDKVVVGLPSNMDGSKGPMAEAAERFAEALRAALNLPVELWDERLTSWEAEERLRQAGLSRRREREKGNVDRMAAQLLLQSYMAAKARDA
jgi:putative Holliday junction resolvase